MGAGHSRIRFKRKFRYVDHDCVDWPSPLDIPLHTEDYVPYHLLCPITQELMEQPAITDDGHTYEYEAIKKWLRRSPVDPFTHKALDVHQLHPNRALRCAINEFVASLYEC